MGISMTQENKDLLLKDLCARLPYGVKVNNEIQGDFVLYGICENYIFARTTNKHGWINHADFNIEKIKPYLFPLSSMTKEQEEEYKKTTISDGILTVWTTSTYDWLNKNHFDYRRLIEKCLAVDATGLNIY